MDKNPNQPNLFNAGPASNGGGLSLPALEGREVKSREQEIGFVYPTELNRSTTSKGQNIIKDEKGKFVSKNVSELTTAWVDQTGSWPKSDKSDDKVKITEKRAMDQERKDIISGKYFKEDLPRILREKAEAKAKAAEKTKEVAATENKPSISGEKSKTGLEHYETFAELRAAYDESMADLQRHIDARASKSAKTEATDHEQTEPNKTEGSETIPEGTFDAPLPDGAHHLFERSKARRDKIESGKAGDAADPSMPAHLIDSSLETHPLFRASSVGEQPAEETIEADSAEAVPGVDTAETWKVPETPEAQLDEALRLKALINAAVESGDADEFEEYAEQLARLNQSIVDGPMEKEAMKPTQFAELINQKRAELADNEANSEEPEPESEPRQLVTGDPLLGNPFLVDYPKRSGKDALISTRNVLPLKNATGLRARLRKARAAPYGASSKLAVAMFGGANVPQSNPEKKSNKRRRILAGVLGASALLGTAFTTGLLDIDDFKGIHIERTFPPDHPPFFGNDGSSGESEGDFVITSSPEPETSISVEGVDTSQPADTSEAPESTEAMGPPAPTTTEPAVETTEVPETAVPTTPTPTTQAPTTTNAAPTTTTPTTEPAEPQVTNPDVPLDMSGIYIIDEDVNPTTAAPTTVTTTPVTTTEAPAPTAPETTAPVEITAPQWQTFTVEAPYEEGKPTPWTWAESLGVPTNEVPNFLTEVMGQNWAYQSQVMQVGDSISASPEIVANYTGPRLPAGR